MHRGALGRGVDEGFVSGAGANSPRRESVFAQLASGAAWLLAAWAAINSVTTYVPEAERMALWWACGCAVVAILLVAVSWRACSWRARASGLGTVGLALAGGIYAASRLFG